MAVTTSGTSNFSDSARHSADPVFLEQPVHLIHQPGLMPELERAADVPRQLRQEAASSARSDFKSGGS